MNDVAIIGHGPSPQGRGWGTRIDQCHIVVRMFDCAWQGVEDYGSRYDIGFATLNERALKWFAVESTRKPAQWWMFKHDGMVFDVHTKAPQIIVEAKEANALAKTLGARSLGPEFLLTRGTVAACHAIESLTPDRIILVGFDEVKRRGFMQEPYSKNCIDAMSARPDFDEIRLGLKLRTGVETRTEGHDLNIEMDVIEAFGCEYGVKVCHAEEIW